MCYNSVFSDHNWTFISNKFLPKLFLNHCFYSLQNFLALCASNYYNGCVFHRNIKGFMVQTGDPTGKFVHELKLGKLDIAYEKEMCKIVEK